MTNTGPSARQSLFLILAAPLQRLSLSLRRSHQGPVVTELVGGRAVVKPSQPELGAGAEGGLTTCELPQGTRLGPEKGAGCVAWWARKA